MRSRRTLAVVAALGALGVADRSMGAPFWPGRVAGSGASVEAVGEAPRLAPVTDGVFWYATGALEAVEPLAAVTLWLDRPWWWVGGYAPVLDPAPIVRTGPEGDAEARSGVSASVVSIGGRARGVRFDFDASSPFFVGERLWFGVAIEGTARERFGVSAWGIPVPSSGGAPAVAVGLGWACRRRRRVG